jgi:hypothetical protein
MQELSLSVLKSLREAKLEASGVEVLLEIISCKTLTF